MAKKSLAVALLGSFLLHGCGVIIPGTPWEERPAFKGPMLLNGVRAQVLWRCAAVDHLMSRGPCEIGYRNQQGEVVTLEQIKAELHDFLPKVQLKKPVRLYLLTISPTVILAVPGRKDTPLECGGTSYQVGCQAYETHVFQFGPAPEIGENSFWFSPTLKIGPVPVPVKDEVDIPLPGSVIQLKAAGSYWSYLRK